MSRKTKGERLLAKLNAIESAELAGSVSQARPAERPVRDVLTPDEVEAVVRGVSLKNLPGFRRVREETVVARGLHGPRRPPQPTSLVAHSARPPPRPTAQDVLAWYQDAVSRYWKRRLLTEDRVVVLNAELNERAAALTHREYRRLATLLQQWIKQK